VQPTYGGEFHPCSEQEPGRASSVVAGGLPPHGRPGQNRVFGSAGPEYQNATQAQNGILGFLGQKRHCPGQKPRFQGCQPRIPEHQNTIYDKLVFWIFGTKTPLRTSPPVAWIVALGRHCIPASRTGRAPVAQAWRKGDILLFAPCGGISRMFPFLRIDFKVHHCRNLGSGALSFQG
jgi:hypothetical protein